MGTTKNPHTGTIVEKLCTSVRILICIEVQKIMKTNRR